MMEEARSLSIESMARSDKRSSVVVVLSLVFILFKEEKERSHSALVTAIVRAIWTTW